MEPGARRTGESRGGAGRRGWGGTRPPHPQGGSGESHLLADLPINTQTPAPRRLCHLRSGPCPGDLEVRPADLAAQPCPAGSQQDDCRPRASLPTAPGSRAPPRHDPGLQTCQRLNLGRASPGASEPRILQVHSSVRTTCGSGNVFPPRWNPHFPHNIYWGLGNGADDPLKTHRSWQANQTETPITA